MASKTLTIEVGNEFIKICEIQRNKKTVMVHNAISIQTPSDTVEDGFVKDISQVSEAIRKALTEEQIIANEVTFILSSSRVATKEVILPLVKKDKLKELVNANASDYFPVNIDDYVLSFTVLEEKKTKEEQKSRILVYAAPEAMVESYYNLAKVLGMKVKAVDYAGNSTLQLIKIQIDEKPTLVVQIGMDTTIVSVMSNDVLQLQRTIPYGESLILNALMESKKVSAKVALELLSSATIVKESIESDDTTASLKYLVSNVNRVIEYYSGRNAETPLQKMVIIGDGADILGIDSLFTNETSLPAERLTLLKNVESYNRIKVSTSKLKQYMANIGAALDPIHLQPKTEKVAATTKNKQVNIIPYVAAMAVMVVVAVGVAVVPMIKFNGKESDRDDLQSKINKISDINDVLADYYTAADKYTDIKNFYNSTANSEEWIVEFMETLEHSMPSDMHITTFTSTSGIADFSGACGSKAEVATLETALKQCGNVLDVQTSAITEIEGANYVTFTMRATFDSMYGLGLITDASESEGAN